MTLMMVANAITNATTITTKNGKINAVTTATPNANHRKAR